MPVAEIEIDSALPTVLGFSSDFGEGHAILAMHAALPLGLTPDLAHLIRINFAPDVPWIAEVDLLLSPLCRPVAKDVWEMQPAIRELLLEELRLDPDFGSARLLRIANFVYNYCALAAKRPGNLLLKDYYRAQQLAALSYLAPERAAREIASAIAYGIQTEEDSETLRISKLARALGEPLYSQRELVVYATGIGELFGENPDQASSIFASLGSPDQEVVVGGVALPPPNAVGNYIETRSTASTESAVEKEHSELEPGSVAVNTCFVIMGFGEKTDYQTQRTLNLDKTYLGVIKPAVEESGLKCVRSDDIIHSGTIDKPIYELLLEADLVIADLSTANPNAIYELGVRHALRPNTTIIMVEDEFKFPFDINHRLFITYEHMGKGIDFEEAMRLRALLKERITNFLKGDPQPDSPVYEFLDIEQPKLRKAKAAAAPEQEAGGETDGTSGTATNLTDTPSPTLKPVKSTCFVIMGFGEKTDYPTQRILNLDKTYIEIIKPAVEQCGLKCIRADDIIHSGTIDKPIYELLLEADLVIADLSTANPNAIYQLGIRHALRPNTTIIMVEDEFKFPFDINHRLFITYKHEGKGIEFEEAERVRKMLVTAINELVFQDPKPDSPVYEFLDIEQPEQAAGAMPVDDVAFSALLDSAQEAREAEDFVTAKVLFKKLYDMNESDVYEAYSDPYIVQQWALATYKSPQQGEAGKLAALLEAREILEQNLEPSKTNDPETLGIWGAIHQRLWKSENTRDYLDTAIRAYERAFQIGNDPYNGTQVAFLLNVRASISTPEQAAVDSRRAFELYSELVRILTREIEAASTSEKADSDDLFWLQADLVEAKFATGSTEEARSDADRLVAASSEVWMAETVRDRLVELEDLLSRIKERTEKLHQRQADASAVFVISYRREDSADHVRRLSDRLRSEFGEDAVLVDYLPESADIIEILEERLRRATAVLVVIGNRWLSAQDNSGLRRLDDAGDWVRREIKTALEMNKPVIPVLVGDAAVPSEKDLPEDIAPLAYRNAVQLRDSNYHEDIDQLIYWIKKLKDESIQGTDSG